MQPFYSESPREKSFGDFFCSEFLKMVASKVEWMCHLEDIKYLS